MSFGEAARRLRKARGWTLADVAQASNGELNIGVVGNVERGRHDNPTDKTLSRFARAFGISVAELRREAGLDPTLDELRAEGHPSEFIQELQNMEPDLSPAARAALIATARQMLQRKVARRQPQRPRRVLEPAEAEGATEDVPPARLSV